MGKGLKLLAGGMLAGVVVFLAVIGGQSILSQSKHRTADTTSTTTTNVQTAANNTQTSNTNVATNGVIVDGEKTGGPLPTKTKTTNADNGVTTEDAEKTDGDKPKDEPLKNNDLEQYTLVGEIGKLTLLSVNNANPPRGVKGTFIVYDEEGMQVAAVTNVNKTTVELAPGMYEATLATRDQQHSQTIRVKADQTAQIRFESASFEQETPTNKQDDLPPNTVVTQDTGDTVNTKPTDPKDNTQSAQLDNASTTEQTAPAADDAKLSVSAELHDPNKDSKRAINANFYVQQPNGKQVNSKRGTNSANFSLPAGTYKLTARYANSNISRDITLTKSQKQNEVFTFKLPVTQGKLSVKVVSEDKKSPVKSNIYIQRQDGKHIAKANYSSNGQFMLDPGTYKVTVKAKNMQPSARLLKVAKDKTTKETFSLSAIKAKEEAQKPVLSPAKTPKPETTNTATQKPANNSNTEAPVWEKPNNIPWKKDTAQKDGTVEIAILDGNTPLRGRFVIRDQQGNRIASSRGKRSGEFELKPGKYSVIAVHKRVRRIRYVDVKPGKSYKVNFTADQFVPSTQGQNTTNQVPAQQTTQQPSQPTQNVKAGKLKLTAISAEDGSPIPVEFTITTPRGVVLQSVKNIAHFQMTLAPQVVIATMRDGSLKSSQRIEVRDNQEAVFTFSIENASTQ